MVVEMGMREYVFGDNSLRNYMSKDIKPTRNINKIACGCETCISAMLIQYDFNKWRFNKIEFFYELYINAASTRLSLRSKRYYDEYNNKIFTNRSHIDILACDAASSYHFPSPMTGLKKILKWDCKLSCCSEYPGMKAPYLESSKHIDHFPLVHIIKQDFTF